MKGGSSGDVRAGFGLRYLALQYVEPRPQQLDRSDPDPLPERLCTRIAALPWVEGCAVRLHEEGLHVSGLVMLRNRTFTAAQAEEVRAAARAVDWRLDQIDVSLDPE